MNEDEVIARARAAEAREAFDDPTDDRPRPAWVDREDDESGTEWAWGAGVFGQRFGERVSSEACPPRSFRRSAK